MPENNHNEVNFHPSDLLLASATALAFLSDKIPEFKGPILGIAALAFLAWLKFRAR